MRVVSTIPFHNRNFFLWRGKRPETENNFGGVEYRERAFIKAYTPFDLKKRDVNRDSTGDHSHTYHRDLVKEKGTRGGGFKKNCCFLRHFRVLRDPFLRKNLDPIFFKITFCCIFIRQFFKISQKISNAAPLAPQTLFFGSFADDKGG